MEGNLFKLDDTAFLLCAPYDAQLRPLSGDVAVTAMLWAENDGAARRAILQQLEADTTVVPDGPPAAVLMAPGVDTYVQIKAAGHSGRFGAMLETGSYRSVDGKFVDRRINFPRWTFHFRNREGTGGERCYAIQVRLLTTARGGSSVRATD